LLGYADVRALEHLSVQTVVSVATTLATARRQGGINVGGVSWACSGVRCTTSTMQPAAAVGAAGVAACQGLALVVGAITSFSVASRVLNGSELKQCNSLPAAAPIAATQKRAGQPSYPVSIRTEGLTANGIGHLAILVPFTPKSIRTEGLSVTGTGVVR
jgi:hypothetical protein